MCSRRLLVIIFSTTCPRNATGKAFWVIFSLLRIRWTTAIFKMLNLFLEKHFTTNVHESVAKWGHLHLSLTGLQTPPRSSPRRINQAGGKWIASREGQEHKAPEILPHWGKLQEWLTRSIRHTARLWGHLHCSNPWPPNDNRERKTQKRLHGKSKSQTLRNLHGVLIAYLVLLMRYLLEMLPSNGNIKNPQTSSGSFTGLLTLDSF